MQVRMSHHQPLYFSSQYINHIVHHFVENSQYGDHVVTMFPIYSGNIVNHSVNFHNEVTIYVNRMWSHYGGNLNILQIHTCMFNKYGNRFANIDKKVGSIFNI